MVSISKIKLKRILFVQRVETHQLCAEKNKKETLARTHTHLGFIREVTCKMVCLFNNNISNCCSAYCVYTFMLSDDLLLVHWLKEYTRELLTEVCVDS